MSNRSKAKRFCGHVLTKREMAAVQSLVGMTTQRFGISKKQIKTEARLWHVVKIMAGMEPKQDELFINSVFRIRQALLNLGEEGRRSLVMTADRAAINAFIPSHLSSRQASIAKALRTPMPTKPATSAKPTVTAKEEFYASWEWRTLRLQVIKEHGRACQCCGATPGMKYASGGPVRICVDHIKPISKYWDLRLVRSNLQILCDECNQGKGNWDETDFRPVAEPEEWAEPPFEDIALDVLASMTPANGRAA